MPLWLIVTLISVVVIFIAYKFDKKHPFRKFDDTGGDMFNPGDDEYWTIGPGSREWKDRH